VSDYDAGGAGFSRPGDQEPVGSVGEEAAKLLASLQGWAREHLGEHTRGTGGFGSAYISDGSAACRVCPVCQLIAFARGINPESMEQVSHAAGSMLHALADLVDSAGRAQSRRGAPVQKIDLTDDPADHPADPEDPTWG
jgi:hypothetical protein